MINYYYLSYFTPNLSISLHNNLIVLVSNFSKRSIILKYNKSYLKSDWLNQPINTISQ